VALRQLNTELVAFHIGHDRPGHAVFAPGAEFGCAQSQQPLNFSFAVVRVKIEMQTILALLLGGRSLKNAARLSAIGVNKRSPLGDSSER
jgi:hypothetical protein